MLELKICHEISAIERSCWNALAPDNNPFIRHEFLYALESSGSVIPETGWKPVHLKIEDNGIIKGFMPLYLKNHSYGEYVFDWAWADAYQRYGLDYYPKLVTAIPFSPVTGPRLLTQNDPTELYSYITQQIPQLCHTLHAKSWHLLFPTEKEAVQLKSENLFMRRGCQYQWFNDKYTDFDHFLQQFNSRKRKNVKRERKRVLEHGISYQHLNGNEISPALLDTFYDFYQLTYLKRGRPPYLNKRFFQLLCELIPEQLLFVIAFKKDKAVAGALSLVDEQTLYGRYWGCYDEFHSLHFETCYYQGIEYCIKHNLQRFDSGAQGEHKIQRGFHPVETWSAHWLEDVGFNQAIGEFIAEEDELMQQQINQLKTYLPFKNESK